jgi:cobalt-zinc-cadmium efflux system membrane fusion protein
MRKRKLYETAALLFLCGLFLAGCKEEKPDPKAEAPAPVKVEHEQDVNVVQVDHPEQFPLAAAVEHVTTSQLVVNGVVSPDISRTVPVISLAVGRVVEIKARLGDTVKKGQVLLRVQSADMSGAFSDYRKALADEQLSRTQLERSKLLYDKGAVSLNDLQIAQDTEDKAKTDVENTQAKIHVLGGNPDHADTVVDIHAPISGVITDQQVTNAAGVQGLASPNPFTISDLSNVWVLCDVYENDLVNVHIGDNAEIRLNAYPDKIFTGRISNVGPILDPSLRTAKVRIEVKNPGVIKVGMFVSATLHGVKKETHTVVKATAILHSRDRDWVYVPDGDKKYRRTEVVAGNALPDGMQEIMSGIKPGQQVVTNALVMQNTVEQ